jgi:preprotein translocase subunit SecE
MPARELSNEGAPERKSFLDSVKEWPEITRNYIAELKIEMKRVTWPTRKQVESTTVVVIVTVFAFAAYFSVVDSALRRAITGIQTAFTK